MFQFTDRITHVNRAIRVITFRVRGINCVIFSCCFNPNDEISVLLSLG